MGHDLFIEGRGQLGQLPSCGSDSVVCEKPWELENLQVGKVSHIDLLQVVEN